MSERTGKQSRNILWLLLLLAVILVWVFLRSQGLDAYDQKAAAADRASLIDMDPDDILVDLDDDVSDSVIAEIERTHGIDLVLVSAQSADERFYRAHVDASRADEIISALSARPDVEVAEHDGYAHLSPFNPAVLNAEADPEWEGFPNDPKFKYQWHFDQIHMRDAWKLSDGAGAIVAVLDTGVSFEDHSRFHLVPDLAGVDFVKPYDFVGNNAHANDDHGHGTHVTGTIAQTTNNGIGVAGIARNVKIMPLKVLSGSGSGSVAGIADAIRYAADNGAHVINMSLGGRFPSKVLKKAVKYAYDKGVVVVCAAGNDGRGKISYPAAYPGAFAVAATQFDERTTFYSNWGKELDIAAPGGNTRVDQNGDGQPDGVLQNTIAIGDPTKDDYYGYMGTSMASPHVAGVAALVVSEGVTNPAAVEKILEESARVAKGQSSVDKNRYGAGIVDAKAAVLKARSQSGGWQLLLGALLAAGLAVSARRRGLRLGGGYVAGVVIGASGLFFLPALFGGVSSWPVFEMLSRGLPSWGVGVFGPAYANPVTMSVLLPLGLALLLGGVRGARPALAGLAAGVAGHLLFHSVANIADVQWMAFDSAWLLVNAVLSASLAALLLRPSR